MIFKHCRERRVGITALYGAWAVSLKTSILSGTKSFFRLDLIGRRWSKNLKTERKLQKQTRRISLHHSSNFALYGLSKTENPGYNLLINWGRDLILRPYLEQLMMLCDNELSCLFQIWQKSFVFLITCEVGHESKRCHLGSFFLDVALKSWPGGGGGWSRHIKLI